MKVKIKNNNMEQEFDHDYEQEKHYHPENFEVTNDENLKPEDDIFKQEENEDEK